MQVVWWLKRRKKLSFENRLTVDIKDFIFTLEPEDNLFFVEFQGLSIVHILSLALSSRIIVF